MSTRAAEGAEPPAKRQRVNVDPASEDGPLVVEAETTAKRKLEEAGFDPNDAISAIDPPNHKKPPDVGAWYAITPMTYFCYHGNLPMCRYILQHGGVTTRTGGGFWSPLYAAAYCGHLDVCQWLYENGCCNELRTPTRFHSSGFRPLGVCWSPPGSFAVAQWLILKGALHDDSGNSVDMERVRQDLDPERSSRHGEWRDPRQSVLSWSTNVLETRSSFQSFLMGTLVPRATEHSQPPQVAASPVQCLSGNVGVLKNIAGFVGLVCDAKQLRIHRQLVESLPVLLEEESSEEG